MWFLFHKKIYENIFDKSINGLIILARSDEFYDMINGVLAVLFTNLNM